MKEALKQISNLVERFERNIIALLTTKPNSEENSLIPFLKPWAGI